MNSMDVIKMDTVIILSQGATSNHRELLIFYAQYINFLLQLGNCLVLCFLVPIATM